MSNSNKNAAELLKDIKQDINLYKHMTIRVCFTAAMLILVMFSGVVLSACKGGETTELETTVMTSPPYNETVITTTEPSVKPTTTITTTTIESTTTEAITNTDSTSTTTETSEAAETTMVEPTIETTRPVQTTTAVPTPAPTKSPELSHTVRVTIPEGFSMIQIIDRLSAAGVNTKDALLNSAINDDFSNFQVIREAGMPTGRCWQLEGYLYPDTYEFYRNEEPKLVWNRFLRNFEAKTTSLRSQLARFNWTMDNAVVFASLLEKEAGNPAEVTTVSSVMHNRLNSGMRLDLDASILYVELYIKPNISGDINRFNSYYNTYKTAALPAGAISNPGLRALNAALDPASTDYYYFATDSQEPPVYYYSRTLEEHEALIQEKKIGRYAE